MSNLFGIFIVLYFLFLAIHGSMYSNTLQTIATLKGRIKLKGTNKKEVRAQINRKLNEVKWMIRATWMVYVILFLLHLQFISKIINREDDVYTNAIYLFVGVCILLFVMNWLKGAGSIDKKIRSNQSDIRK